MTTINSYGLYANLALSFGFATLWERLQILGTFPQTFSLKFK